MSFPTRALLPCFLLAALASGHVYGQSQQQQTQGDAEQEAPSFYPETPSTPTHATRTNVSAEAGFVGSVRAAARLLREESIPVTGPAPTRNLRLGDRGHDVQWLIDALLARGHWAGEQPVLSVSYGEAGSWSNDPASTGYYNPGLPQAEFNGSLDSALRAFQASQGMREDGIAGPMVYAALTVDNTALGNAMDSWGANLDRWSNEARSEGYDRMIVVNVPSFTLHAIDLRTNKEILQSRVIVGSPNTRTPLMMTRIVNLKANPDWSPPKSIRGARYQRPGPNNALGLMRFSTDNQMNIYLHDTNARGLFANDKRALSHGCIRVQDWQPLAAWGARQDESWVDEVALAGGKTRFLKIDAIPVVIAYSLVDLVEGQARQFEDVYGKGDEAIGSAALEGRGEAATTSWTQR